MTSRRQPSLSETSICNQALSWIGQHRITSIDERSVKGEWCRENFGPIRDAVIEEGMWRFATVRKKSTTGDKDEFGVHYQHEVPLNWLRVYRVYNSVCGPDPSRS